MMAQSRNTWCWHLGLASSLAISGALALGGGFSPLSPKGTPSSPIAFFGDSAFAQVKPIPDDTLGTQVTPNTVNPNIDMIRGGVTQGVNLFHSFREFNVDAGRGAYFVSPNAQIQNILARVTGSNRSEILGTIGTVGNSIPNLFLINPNGIIFGPNASLDIGRAGPNTRGSGGSFVATTANAVLLGDRGVFSASEPAASNLLTVNPSALFFNNNNVSRPEIINRSIATNSLLGNLPIKGLQVPDGRSLLLVGGDVRLDGGKLTAYGGRVELGGVTGSGKVKLDIDANNLRLSFPDAIARGDISLSNGAEVNANGEGGGEIQVQGRRITLTDASTQIVADTLGSQNGKGISIQAVELIVQNGAQVSASTSTSSTGQGGTLEVIASDSVKLSGTGTNLSGLFAQTEGSGTAGKLTIATKNLIVQDGAQVAASTFGEGQGGTLEVTASDSINLSGTLADSQFPSGLFAQTLGAGDAGTLKITTRNLIAQNGAQVVAGTGINSQGNGGTLEVTASDFVELSGIAADGETTSGLFARTKGTGAAGNLTVATGQLIVRDGAQVTVSGVESGNAGNLKVTARSIRLENQGAIVAETASGEGGNIKLQSQDLLMRRNSNISTTAGGSGNGGNITINTDTLVGLENSDIKANAVEGEGGFIKINSQGIFGLEVSEQLSENSSDITAVSEKDPSLNGVVEINRPDIDPNRGLATLPAELVDVVGLIAQACPAGRGQGKSEFIVTGRGGLPDNPSQTLSSDTVWTDLRPTTYSAENRPSSAIATQSTNSTPGQLVEAQGWVINDKGEVVLTATVPTVTLYIPWMTPASCYGS